MIRSGSRELDVVLSTPMQKLHVDEFTPIVTLITTQVEW